MQAAPSYLAWMNMEGAEAARPPVLAELGRRGGGGGAGLAGVGRKSTELRKCCAMPSEMRNRR